jgi:hypothetical protein
LEEYNEDRTRQIGLLADEVYEVQPELITKRHISLRERREEIKLLDYSKVTALLLEGIKELTKRVTKLENKRHDLHSQQNNLESLKETISGWLEELKRRLSAAQKDPSINIAKSKREEEKWQIDKQRAEEEKAARDLKQHESHGVYKVEPVKGVSLKPTQANMQVMLNYIGGPYSAAERIRSPEGIQKEIAIGVKVLPLRIVNFNKIEDFILNDYFTTRFQSMWRTLSRSFLRKISQIIGKHFKRLDPREYMIRFILIFYLLLRDLLIHRHLIKNQICHHIIILLLQL